MLRPTEKISYEPPKSSAWEVIMRIDSITNGPGASEP